MKPGVWIKSSWSGYNGDCVACKRTRGGVLVRDSKNPQGPVLEFSPAEWRAFLQRLGR